MLPFFFVCTDCHTYFAVLFFAVLAAHACVFTAVVRNANCCVQECELKAFDRFLSPGLHHDGFEGLFLNKAGSAQVKLVW